MPTGVYSQGESRLQRLAELQRGRAHHTFQSGNGPGQFQRRQPRPPFHNNGNNGQNRNKFKGRPFQQGGNWNQHNQGQQNNAPNPQQGYQQHPGACKQH